MKKSIVTALLALVCAAGMAQTTVKGHVVNEKGESVEYISVAVVDSDAYGMLEMQSEFKSSYARSFAKGKIRKLPVGPAILVKGYEVE